MGTVVYAPKCSRFQTMCFEYTVTGFSWSLEKSDLEEENLYLKNVRPAAPSDLLHGAKYVWIHALYMLKRIERNTLIFKTRLALCWNENSLTEILTISYTPFWPISLGANKIIASMFVWNVYRADFQSAFFQSWAIERKFYVKPPRENQMCCTHLWLLFTAAY